jgi:hypothetical protein
MSGPLWLEYRQFCPDCGQVSFIFSRIGDGVALSLGWDHRIGFLPAEEVSRKAARFADRFARKPSLELAHGWRRLDGEPDFAQALADEASVSGVH